MNLQNIEMLFKNANTETISLTDIILEDELQQRQKTDKDAIEAYTEAMKANGVTDWEAIKVVKLTAPHKLPNGVELELGALLLVDGFQRTEAATQANHSNFPASVAEGTYQDAVYFSLIANKYNGVSLTGKDFQKAIKRLYVMEAAWREHGKKKELALLFGCSEKTVQRAVKAIDDEVKGQVFEMFAAGASDKEAALFAHKSEQTIAKWRCEWEAKVEQGEQDAADKEQAEDKASEQAGEVDVLTLTIENALKVTDKNVQAAILAILNQAFGNPETKQEKAKAEPKQEKAKAEPKVEPINEDTHIADLVTEWTGQDALVILGVAPEQAEGWANKKAQFKRAYNKQLKRCHSDKYGENAALELLKEAFAVVKKQYSFK